MSLQKTVGERQERIVKKIYAGSNKGTGKRNHIKIQSQKILWSLIVKINVQAQPQITSKRSFLATFSSIRKFYNKNFY